MEPDLENQLEFEKLYDKNQLIPRLKREFKDNPEIIAHCEHHEIPFKFAVSLLVQMVLHKRANLPTLVGLLHKSFSSPQECADMLLKAAQHDLVDYNQFENMFIIRINVTQDVYDELDQYQYPLPCLIEPKKLTCNRDTGYYGNVTGYGSVILQTGNHHDYDVNLDHLNNSNKIPLSINTEVARLVQNKWRNLDGPKPHEDFSKYQQRVKAFNKYDKSSRDIMETLFMMGNKFYLTHKYDKRGRTYPQGYHVNTQGNPWNKAVIEFHDKEITTG